MNKPNLYEPKFSGALAEPLQKFLDEKRSIGYIFHIQAKLLARFDRFSLQLSCPQNVLTKEMVMAWTMKSANEKQINQYARIILIRQFALFMLRNGYAAFVIDSGIYGKVLKKEFSPHIYSTDELRRIFKTLDHYKPSVHSPKRHLIFPLLFRILYGCGLRISEALNLTLGEANTENGILTIKGAKFDKERFVPMADTLNAACKKYINECHYTSTENAVFFPSPRNGSYSYSAIVQAFKNLLWQSGIPHGGRGKGPRLHDFRHTFAVHCLKGWVLNGINISAVLPLLSAYMWHKDLAGTQPLLKTDRRAFSRYRG